MSIRAEIYDFSHDTNGNGTSHFTLWEGGEVLFKSKRRVQVGYNDRTDGAFLKAQAIAGEPLRVVSVSGGIHASISATFLTYLDRVERYIAEGMSRGDAQGVVEAEDLARGIL